MHTQKKGPLLFLYSRLPDYFYKCIRDYVNRYDTYAIIVRYAGDVNTKYEFEGDPRVTMHFKHETDVPGIIKNSGPSAIYLSGWNDSVYKNAAKKYVKTMPVILGLDNPWVGNMKQWLLCFASFFYIRTVYNMVWVAGESQYRYAEKLGFHKKNILEYLYAADTAKFYDKNEIQFRKKSFKYPRTVVFLGRLVKYKQPDLLADVFGEPRSLNDDPWKLIIAGEGPLKETIEQNNYENVEIIPFVMPHEIPSFYGDAGIFCLPSNGEHWGVAVQEAAAAGLPLLLSDSVESGKIFLKTGENGYSFKAGNKEDLKDILNKMMNLPNSTLLKMGMKSKELSKTINHEKWSTSLKSAIDHFYAN